jgi:glycosyltransferase involved in cell wall biosynthesis
VLARYGDGCANWLFVGRIVPNKRQDDLIRTLAYYQHQIDPTARLLLVGSFFDTPGYHSELERLARRLAATNVEFCGMAPDDALGAYYRVATGYVSMSEHEGFGLPLLEAMHIGVPVIAYAAAAAPGTLGQAGVLIHRKRFEVVAELLWLIATDADLRAQLVARQRERVTEFAPDQVARHLRNMVESLQ